MFMLVNVTYMYAQLEYTVAVVVNQYIVIHCDTLCLHLG